jgi:hypothetical protein
MPTSRPIPPLRASASRARLGAAAWALLFALPLLLGSAAQVDERAATCFGLAAPACAIGSLVAPELCPGCGLSRGVALLLHGHGREALRLAPAAPAIVLACALGLALQLAVLARGRRLPFHAALREHGGRALAASLLLAWFVRVL